MRGGQASGSLTGVGRREGPLPRLPRLVRRLVVLAVLLTQAEVAAQVPSAAMAPPGSEQLKNDPESHRERPEEPVPTVELDWHESEAMLLLAKLPDLVTRFDPASHDFTWPLAGAISSYFGWRDISVAGNRFHGGIDIVAAPGTPVAAAADGIVELTGWVGAYGYAVYLVHADASESRYAHLESILVRRGDFVRQGDLVGLSGGSGAVTGPHLHFEIRVAGEATDPLPLLR